MANDCASIDNVEFSNANIRIYGRVQANKGVVTYVTTLADNRGGYPTVFCDRAMHGYSGARPYNHVIFDRYPGMQITPFHDHDILTDS